MAGGSAFVLRCQTFNSLYYHNYTYTFCAALSISTTSSSLEKSNCVNDDEDCRDFLPWLRQKSGAQISSSLSIGRSTYGRCLFASKCIYAGDVILEVPYSMQLSPNTLLPHIKSLLENEVVDIEKLATVILVEQKLGQDSKWPPYVSCLLCLGDMNSMVFWSKDDLQLIEKSSLYQETIKQRTQIEEDFLEIKPVQIKLDIPHDDPLRSTKMDLLNRHSTPEIQDDNAFSSSGTSFVIKQVKSASRKGRGIPQSLWAFARVTCATSPQELTDFAIEAAKTDGRLGRVPLKNKTRELQAHRFLLLKITQLIENHHAGMKPLSLPNSPCMSNKVAIKRKLAWDLLAGELRVLQSAGAWLKKYCDTL